jgi:alcohol dehydrogenase (cytochrome c)
MVTALKIVDRFRVDEQREKEMLRASLVAALIGVALPVTAFAQTADDLKNDAKTPGDVLTYGMGYSGQRYSESSSINRDNVK